MLPGVTCRQMDGSAGVGFQFVNQLAFQNEAKSIAGSMRVGKPLLPLLLAGVNATAICCCCCFCCCLTPSPKRLKQSWGTYTLPKGTLELVEVELQLIIGGLCLPYCCQAFWYWATAFCSTHIDSM